MMELYLLRHGIAEEAAAGKPDSERALTSEGKRRLGLVLKRASRANVSPSLILTSPYKRAVQTAQLVVEILKYEGELVQSDALLPSAKPEGVWDEIRPHQRESQLLLAGHDPLFSHLAGYLLGFPGLRIDFRKGALLRIDFDRYGPQPQGTLRWFLVPKLV